MAAGRPRDRKQAEVNLRLALGCATTERTLDAALRVVAERAALERKVADLVEALRIAWSAHDASATLRQEADWRTRGAG